MKKIHIFGLALLMAMAGACKKNQNQDTSTFSASIEIDESNRTYLDGMKVRWSAGDPIIVYGNGDSQTYTLSQGAGDQTATFTTTGGVQPASTYRAFYPATSCRGVNDDVFTFTMPDTQTYTADGFMSNLNPMAGKNDGNGGTTLGFRNAFAVAKFSTKGNRSVSKIELEVPSDKYVSGTFTFNYANGTTTYSSDGTQIITLNCTSPVALNSTTEEDFYFVLPPGSIDNGFTIRYYQPNSNTPFATKTVAASTPGIALARNTIKTFQTTAEAQVQYVTNLLPELDVNGQNWSILNFYGCNTNYPSQSHYNGTVDVTIPRGNCYIIETSSDVNEGYLVPNNSPTYINGHQYYFRWWSRKEGIASVQGGSVTSYDVDNIGQDLYWPLDENHRWVRNTTAGNDRNWTKNSVIFDQTASGSGNFRFDVNNNRKIVKHFCFADAILIDLTADYTNQGRPIPEKATLDGKAYFFGQRDIDTW